MLEAVFREPLAIEAFFAILLLLVFVAAWRTLRGVAGRVSRRRALKEFVAGVDLYFKGEHEAARDALAAVLERDPENHEARILLGDACRELGDVAEAHKHHWQVAKVFGQDLPRNRLSLGRDLLLMGKAPDAIEHLARSAEADPDDTATLDLLLTANLEAGRLDEAVALARRLEEEARGEAAPRARRRRATVCALAGRERVRRGETKDGERLLRSAIRLNPALVSPRLELVRSAWMNGTSRAAEKELVGHLKEMARLAEDGEIVFEPPARNGAGAAAGAVAGASAEVTALPLPAAPAPDDRSGARSVGTRASLPAPGAGAAVPARSAGTGAVVARPDGPVAAAGAGAAAPADIPEAPLPMDAQAFAAVLLAREAVYLCAACGRGEIHYRETCPECGAFGSLLAADGTALAPVPDMPAVFDEIVENRAFLRKLVKRAAAGDEAAADRLVRAGPRAVSGIFREMLRVPDHSALVHVLAAMGPGSVPAILRGFRRANSFSTKRLVREGVRAFRSLDGLVVLALARMGEAVLPALEPLLDAEERVVRQIALDVLVRLGAADRLERARLGLPSKELIDRLNACPEEDLDPLLDASAPDGYLAQQVFADRTFAAESALARALGRTGNRRKMREILIRRGFSARAYDALEVVWEDPEARVMVRDVVRSYGRAAADHLIKTFTSPQAPEAVREDALGLFLDLGEDEIERLVERLAEGDPETERAVLRAVLAFGSRAVPALVRAYGKTGLFQRVGLNRRRLAFRKMTLLRALGQIGTHDALQGLRRILDREGDPDLKRKIRGILDRRSGREGER